MRITVVSRIFAPEPAAASERLSTLCRQLAEDGHEVTVLTTRAPGGAQVATPYRVRRWPVLRDRQGYVRGYVPYLSFDVPAFFRVLFSRRADLVVVEPPPTTGFMMRIACALRRTPYAYYAADIWSLAAGSTGASGLVVGVVRRMEAAALAGARVCLAVTEHVAERVRALAPRARVTVVGHGVDDRTFHHDVTPLPGIPAAVYVGTASEWHGAGVFVEAIAVARRRGVDVRALFVGQGGEWDSLREAVTTQGLDDLVSFRSPVAGAEAAAILSGARVALASLRPGIGYDFAVPTKAYSALAVGTPVLYAGPDPTRSLIADNDLGAGCVPDPETVAGALIELTAVEPSPQRRERIAGWASQHLSGRAVAQRAVEALVGPGFTDG